jgi:uncharacterized protein (DUF1778 family)
MENEAEADLAARTLNLRWDEEHIAVVKRAAATIGVPLSSYAKHVLIRQARADIEAASHR